MLQLTTESDEILTSSAGFVFVVLENGIRIVTLSLLGTRGLASMPALKATR